MTAPGQIFYTLCIVSLMLGEPEKEMLSFQPLKACHLFWMQLHRGLLFFRVEGGVISAVSVLSQQHDRVHRLVLHVVDW